MNNIPLDDQLSQAAQAVFERLKQRTPALRIVLAESCTGGLVAASLVQVPGISEFFCGSSVVYREATKTAWLDVPTSLIEQHTAESAEVTAALATAALAHTPEATFGVAVTGHLQSDRNRTQPQPHVFVSAAAADGIEIAESAGSQPLVLCGEDRRSRQQAATLHVLTWITQAIR